MCNDEQKSKFTLTDNNLITPTDQIKYGAGMIYQEVIRQTDDQLSMIHDSNDLTTSEKIALANQVQNREICLMVFGFAIMCLVLANK